MSNFLLPNNSLDNIITRGKANIGTNSREIITTVVNPLASCVLGVGSTDLSANTNMNVFGTYYSDNAYVTTIASSNSASRPNVSKAGYIRYNTDFNAIEFWNNSVLSWQLIQSFSSPATITGATFSILFADSNGQNITSTPYGNGYTLYIITAASSGTFATPSSFAPYITYLITGGGGAGGAGDSLGSGGGGGGAGGYLVGYRAINASTTFTINVGLGGTGVVGGVGNTGTSSSFIGTGISLTASGGGGGGNTFVAGAAGASGGGGGLRNNVAGGSGTSGQGNAGGASLFTNGSATGRGGGGGGALAIGASGSGPNIVSNIPSTPGGNGGAGITNYVTGSAISYAGGGGAGGFDRSVGPGGLGGGGSGSGLGSSSAGYNIVGTAGTTNLGGGGGGSATGTSASSIAGGAGGSGILILRHLTNPILSNILPTFNINGATYPGIFVLGAITAAAGPISPSTQSGMTTSVGGAVVTYVDSNGINSRAFALGPYSGGYTIVTFNGTTSATNRGIITTPTQVLCYQNRTTYTFTPLSNFPPQVDYLIVGGGGSGAKGTGGVCYGGGGGGGQVLSGTITLLAGTLYSIVVGSGAAFDNVTGEGPNNVPNYGRTINFSQQGINSSAFGLIAYGGLGGSGGPTSTANFYYSNTNTINALAYTATNVGSGGISGAAVASNGFLGGSGYQNPAGGGGGAADYGRVPSSNFISSGGSGIASAISGALTGYGAGAGGSGDLSFGVSAFGYIGGSSPAGVKIGGDGGTSSFGSTPTNGVAGSGSGGGGNRADDSVTIGAGGAGVIIIRFPSYLS